MTVAWCFDDETTDHSDFVLNYVRKHGAVVPTLWMSEITNVLLTAMKKNRLDWDRALDFLEAVMRLPIRVANLSTKEHFASILPLAKTHQMTTYDATYLYLAVREKKPLATHDLELKAIARRLKLPKLGG